MKKILLGLLAVSAIAMGNTSPSDGSTSVQIETRAFIVNSGLAIEGELVGGKVVLDHGVLMKGDSANSQRIATTNIKKVNNEAIPAGTGIELSVTGDHILKNNTASLGHTLEIAAGNDSAGILLPIGKGKQSKYVHTVEAAGVEAIPVTIKSTITAEQLKPEGVVEGQYTNEVTLNVRYSKLGTEIAVPLKK